MGAERTVPHPPSFAVRCFLWGVALVSKPFVRRLTRRLVAIALVFRALVPWRTLQGVWLSFLRREAACCRCDSPHFRFMQRYVERFERAGTFERARRFLLEGDRRSVAATVDAWLRIGLIGTLRHEVLQRHRGAPGVPERLLLEAQLALSPACDLACEGCYSADDRGGTAPRRDDIAWLVDELAACGAFVIHVVGKGEPFLSRAWAGELLDVIEERPHLFFTVATHGGHVDEQLAARLGRLGNLLTLVAVDGPEAIHDARRGPGAYRRAHEAFERLRRHGASFGWSCMVSAKSHAAVVDPAFIAAQAEAGCAVGVYSRYFPLSSAPAPELALDALAEPQYRRALEAAQAAAAVPLVDLDEMDHHTGCHARAGETVYVDGITGQVSPCLRVPFAPPECRIGRGAGWRLHEVLAHPYFVEYRRGSVSCPSSCAADLGRELGVVAKLLDLHAPRPARLETYRLRSLEAANPPEKEP